MIAELFLILDLLPDTVQTNGTPKSPAVKPTKGSTANLAAGLFGIGPITEIKQSFKIAEFGLKDATSAFLEAGIGLPKEKKGRGGRF